MPKAKLDINPTWREKAKEIIPAERAFPKIQSVEAGFVFGATTGIQSRCLESAQLWQPNLRGRNIEFETEKALKEIQGKHRLIALWVIKEQSKFLRPSIRKILGTDENYKFFLAYEPDGDIWNSLYSMAYGIFDYLEIDEDQSLLQYPDWGNLWLSAFSETSQAQADAYLSRNYKFSSKTSSITTLWNLHKSLSEWNIPDNMAQHTKNLLTHGMQIAKHNPRDKPQLKKRRKQFREKYWIPYLKALKRYIAWHSSPNHSQNLLPQGMTSHYPQRDRKTGHIYSKPGGRKKKYLYKQAMQAI